MLAHRLAHVIDKLELTLGLGERAIALIGAQRVTEFEVTTVRRTNVEVRHAGGVRFVEVQPRNTGVRCGSCPVAVRDVKDVVSHPAETELVDHGRADRIRPSERQALVRSR